jgi:hypothetical protein
MTNGKSFYFPILCRLPPAAKLPGPGSRSEKDFQDPLLAGAAHRMNASCERILFANQAVYVERFFFQKVQRRLKTSAARSYD